MKQLPFLFQKFPQFVPGRCIISSVFLCLVICLTAICPSAQANTQGEIINISQQYKVAFIDIGNDSLSTGDVVEVSTNDNQPVYLQAVETNVGLSKLGFINTQEYRTDSSGFERIIVGNTVSIVSRNSPGADRQDPAVSSMQKTGSDQKYAQLVDNLEEKEKEVDDLKRGIQDLETLNRSLKKDNSQLFLEKHIQEEERGQRLQEINNLNSVISQLKVRLENIKRLLPVEGNTLRKGE